MSLNDFQILSKLGELTYILTLLLGDGSYSCVYKVKRIEDNIEYALKKVKVINLSEREKENALNEVRILASIRHKNVASYKEAFFDEQSSSLCIVMEYADNGDVFQKICEHQQNGTFMKEKIIWKIIIQTVRGLKALHDLKILHRDMKSANIFLFKDYTAKLGDLNVSKVAKKGLLYTQTGTPYYASPEVWKDQPYDSKSDIWSLGCVIYEMCALVPPFRAEDMNGLFKRILKGSYPPIPAHYSMELRAVIKSLIQVDPRQRPNCDQILEMPIMVKRTRKYFKDEIVTRETIDSESELLRTIKISNNIFKLKLPKAAYEQMNFATLPQHQNKYINSINKSRNASNMKTQSHGVGAGNSIMSLKQNLPKIKSISKQVLNPTSGGNDHTYKTTEEDDYEQDFENPEEGKDQRSRKESNQVKNIGTKSRSYSGRKEIEVRGQAQNTNKNKKQSLLPGTESSEPLPPISQRSKNSEDGGHGHSQLQQSVSQPPISKTSLKQDSRSKNPKPLQLSGSNSQHTLQTNDNSQSIQSIQQVAIVRPSKQGQKSEQPHTIEEKEEDETQKIVINKKSVVPKKVFPKPLNQVLMDQYTEKPSKRMKNDVSSSSFVEEQSLRNQNEEQPKKVYGHLSKLDDINYRNQLSNSPSGMSLDISPLAQAGRGSLNPQIAGSKKSLPLSHQLQNHSDSRSKESVGIVSQNKYSPNFKRIVNIYSINSQSNKRKRHGPSNVINSSYLPISNTNAPSAYRDEIQDKLKKIYENERSQSLEGNHQNNSQIQLPELKSATPQLINVKNQYQMMNNGSYSSNNNNSVNMQKMMNRKKSYERLMRLDQQLYNLYKHQNQGVHKVDGSHSRVANVYGSNSKSRNYGVNGGAGASHNYSYIGSRNNELDIQGKSMISKHQINNSFM